MFRCNLCKNPSAKREKPTKVVAQTREKEYKSEYDKVDELGKSTHYKILSNGYEIVKELQLCPPCALDRGLEAKVAKEVVPYKPKFQEDLAPQFTQPLIGLAIESVTKRLDHKSKRADRDFAAVATNLNEWLREHREFVWK